MPFKKIFAGLVLFILVLVIFIQGMIIGMPFWAESLVKAKLPELPGGFDPQFSIASIGIRKTIVRDLRLGKDIRADSLELDYAWNQEYPFQVTRIRLSGIDITVSLDSERTIRINGMLLDSGATDEDPISLSYDLIKQLLPFIPGQVILAHSRLHLDLDGTPMELPFYGRAVLFPQTGRADAHAVVSILGQSVKITAGADMKDGLTRLSLESLDLSPACLAEKFVPASLPVCLTGPFEVAATMSKDKNWQFSLGNLGLKGKSLPGMRIEKLTGSFDTAARSMALSAALEVSELTKPPLPLNLQLTAVLTDHFPFDVSVSCGPISTLAMVQDSIPWNLPDIFGSLDIKSPDVTIHVSGDNRTQNARIDLSCNSLIAENKRRDLKLSTSAVGFSAQSHGNLFSRNLSPDINWTLATDTVNLRSKHQVSAAKKLQSSGGFTLDLTRYAALEQAEMTVRLDRFTGDYGRDKIKIEKIGLSATSRGLPGSQTVTFSSTLEPAGLVSGGTSLAIPRSGCSGLVRMFEDRPLEFDLTPWAEDARLVLTDYDLTARGMAFKTRITRPFIQGAAGHVKIPELSFQKRLKAQGSSQLAQVDDTTFRLTGSLASPDLTDKKIEINIKAGIAPDPWADFHAASRHFLISGQSVKTLFPKIKLPGAISIDTTADVWASYRYGVFSSTAALEIHSGSVTLPDMNLSADGITGLVGIRDLVNLESYPGQLLNIDTITMGQFKFDKAVLRFRIEDPGSVGIENLKFNWCNGLVSSEAVQLPAKDGNARLIFFCDRLEMDSLLNQMGGFDAKGSGTLSGRIPVTYKDGSISFENGFLFSTPGKGGRVFVRNLDRLMAGFPKGTPESSYIEMAGEALKDFQYNWATLNMSTQGDTLTVNMGLDGKPARILPFEFRKDINAFVRVDAASPGAHFQGIKLDLNLKLPFNQVAKFGKKIKAMTD